MTPQHFRGVNIVFQPPDGWDADLHGPCMELPVMQHEGVCISCWAPSWLDILRMILGRRLYVHVASGKTQPPVALTIGLFDGA